MMKTVRPRTLSGPKGLAGREAILCRRRSVSVLRPSTSDMDWRRCGSDCSSSLTTAAFHQPSRPVPFLGPLHVILCQDHPSQSPINKDRIWSSLTAGMRPELGPPHHRYSLKSKLLPRSTMEGL